MKLKYDYPLSNVAFNSNPRPSIKGLSIDVTEFAKQHKAGTLPAEKDNGKLLAIRWKTAGAPDANLDLETWLPIFVDGAREPTEKLRMIAVQGRAFPLQNYSPLLGSP